MKSKPGRSALRSLDGNRLLYGDNLTLMQDMKSASVDLIYLDPPFNSQRTYNLLYRNLVGAPVPEQEEAFCDAWEMDAEKIEMLRQTPEFMRKAGVSDDVTTFWSTWMNALRGTQPKLLAYLLFMSWRLVEMRRILRPEGSLYLHCDPTASHYIKVILDGIFGHGCFQSEIIWKRTNARGTTGRWPRLHDVILHYSRTAKFLHNPTRVKASIQKIPHTLITGSDGLKYQTSELTGPGLTKDGESGRPWRGFDPGTFGRHWANTHATMDAWDAAGCIHWPRNKGFPRRRAATPFVPEDRQVMVGDVWTDIDRINQSARERLGYPTQKPITLLKRIIEASSKPGDIVFDPFCGCGTAIYAAHETGRHWIGADIAILSVRIVRDVLATRYGLREGQEYEVSGVPLSVDGARELAAKDKRQFQHWAVELSGGFVNSRHSGDRGIDGRIWFDTRDGLRSMVLSVKGGSAVNPSFVRELVGTVSSEREAELGGFICLESPSKGMINAAIAAGHYEYLGRKYARVQLRSVEDLLSGRGFDTPSRVQTLGWERQGVLPFELAPAE